MTSGQSNFGAFDVTREQLAADFHAEMIAIYRRALHNYGHRATNLLQLIRAHGGAGAARRLVYSEPDEGQLKLWELIKEHGLPVSVELLMLKPKFRPLFTADDLTRADQNLDQIFGSSAPKTTPEVLSGTPERNSGNSGRPGRIFTK